MTNTQLMVLSGLALLVKLTAGHQMMQMIGTPASNFVPTLLVSILASLVLYPSLITLILRMEK